MNLLTYLNTKNNKDIDVDALISVMLLAHVDFGLLMFDLFSLKGQLESSKNGLVLLYLRIMSSYSLEKQQDIFNKSRVFFLEYSANR